MPTLLRMCSLHLPVHACMRVCCCFLQSATPLVQISSPHHHTPGNCPSRLPRPPLRRGMEGWCSSPRWPAAVLSGGYSQRRSTALQHSMMNVTARYSLSLASLMGCAANASDRSNVLHWCMYSLCQARYCPVLCMSCVQRWLPGILAAAMCVGAWGDVCPRVCTRPARFAGFVSSWDMAPAHFLHA